MLRDDKIYKISKVIIRCITTFLEDDNLRKNMARLVRQRAEKEYNWTVTAQNLLDAYKKASR